MEIAKDKITEIFCIIDDFVKNMIKRLPACPFVSRTSVSTAIGNVL